MSDNVDPRKAALQVQISMADLSRVRQEELPLSNIEKRGPSYNPTGKNSTSKYSREYKDKLGSSWNTTFDDEEARQVEGLHIEDARPWAKKFTKNFLETAGIDVAPPRAEKRIRRDNGPGPMPPRKKLGGLEFKPAAPVPWGPGPSTSSGPSASPALKGQPKESQPKTTKEPIEVSAPTPPAPLLQFVLRANDADHTASEQIVGSGQCEVIPSKHEAMCYLAEVQMKLKASEASGVLEIFAATKGRTVLDALKIDDPVMDGQFCAIKMKSEGSMFYLRFSDLDETKKFRRYLSKLQRSVRIHQQQSDLAHVTRTEEAETKTETKVTSPSIKPTPSAPAISTRPSKDLAMEVAKESERLISMGDWQEVHNHHAPTIQNAASHIVKLVTRVLEEMAQEQPGKKASSSQVIKGIEEGIIEHWVQNGFLDNCTASLRDDFIKVLRSMADLQIKLHRHMNGEDDEDVNEDIQDLSRAIVQPQTAPPAHGSVRGGLKGLGSSIYATKPAAFEGRFTGIRLA
ncbi:hypothetical protein FALBO_5175 [Fusarium albosuccineum]|uniref:Uncharacterized protein n=1 Tax=Fusarium albosuccineum TaxID=1237068 RepID=A0A8H4PFQ3_9HYPO|nr:hypothetical protein FALBO_5175 [Fusarium albosuccineum]